MLTLLFCCFFFPVAQVLKPLQTTNAKIANDTPILLVMTAAA
jgi:hypothetical protein